MDKKAAILLLVGGGAVVLLAAPLGAHVLPGKINPNVVRWTDYIRFASKATGVPAGLIAAIIEIESSGRADVIGASDEFGLMQIKCPTAVQVGFSGDCKELLDPKTNILFGTKYLQWQLKRYNGDIQKTVSAYNAGTATSANRSYVDKVMSFYQLYRRSLL